MKFMRIKKEKIKYIGWGILILLSINMIIKVIQTIYQSYVLENPLIPKYVYGYTISIEIFQLFILSVLISMCIIGIRKNKLILIPLAIVIYLVMPWITLLFDNFIYNNFINN